MTAALVYGDRFVLSAVRITAGPGRCEQAVGAALAISEEMRLAWQAARRPERQQKRQLAPRQPAGRCGDVRAAEGFAAARRDR